MKHDRPLGTAPVGATSNPGTVARLVSHPALIAACLAAAAGLAWLWLLRQPDSGAMPGMAPDPWSLAYLASAFTMWLLMMVAMMLPSAAPMILFYARFASRSGMAGSAAATVLFALTYVAVWAVFSLLAVLLQASLVASGLVSAMELAFGDRRLAGGVLLLAGLYQLSPLKQTCLVACRSPVDFLMRLWRPGTIGALRLGAVHGVHCLGCCWALMLLLFVGGVMSLAWIGGLALLILAEKTAPAALHLRYVLGAALTLGGLAPLVVAG